MHAAVLGDRPACRVASTGHVYAPESATGHQGPHVTRTASDVERDAMRRALELAATPGVPLGPNPRVGCVILDDRGEVAAEGFHRGAGSPHAEAEALARAR